MNKKGGKHAGGKSFLLVLVGGRTPEFGDVTAPTGAVTSRNKKGLQTNDTGVDPKQKEGKLEDDPTRAPPEHFQG